MNNNGILTNRSEADADHDRQVAAARGGTGRPAPTKPTPEPKRFTIELSEADHARFVDTVVMRGGGSPEAVAAELLHQFMTEAAEPALAWFEARRKASDRKRPQPFGANVWQAHEAAVGERIRNEVRPATELANAVANFVDTLKPRR